MPQLLLELFSEEIPARMQAKAEADLLKAVMGKLKEAGLTHGEAFAWSGPRRLGVCVEDVAARSQDVRVERKGPKVGAPDKAVEGFMRGAGLASIDEAEIRSDPKKGEFYVAVIETPGRDAAAIIAEMVPQIITGFSWPKSMRSGPNALTGGTLRWVRPLQRILCVLGGKTVPFTVDGIASGNQTEGHRVHGRGPFTITGWDDYQAQLETDGHVRLRREDRKALIARDAARVCKKAGLELVPDEGLLEEVTGLAEYPVVILGDMDPDFLTLPPEVIRLSMRTHQKYFAVRDPKTGDLAPHFLVVANIKARDRGKTIAAGNAKVLSARLQDARFFYENDVKTGLDAMAEKLDSIIFKDELGSYRKKVDQIFRLAVELAENPTIEADKSNVEQAARFSRADLVSEMVYEFPELQATMGGYYALEHKFPTEVAQAISEQYLPQGPSDPVPTQPVSVALALAEKLDTLAGFWVINQKPTGSKDPYALRRAALGVVRIVLANEVRFKLLQVLLRPFARNQVAAILAPSFETVEWVQRLRREGKISEAAADQILADDERRRERAKEWCMSKEGSNFALEKVEDLLAFFADRLKQVLRDEGKRHDLIDAVFALGEDDLVLIVKRVEALTDFLATEDGANLLAGYKRAANILKAEEKKDGERAFDSAPDPAHFTDPAERDLHTAIETAETALAPALEAEDFEAAMAHLAQLRAPVDAFFEAVMVNADDPKVRETRLKLLAKIRSALHSVADFSKIES